MISEEDLIIRVCRIFGVLRAAAFSKSRRRELVMTRQMLCYVLRREGYTWRRCGELVHRDHATALSGARTFREHLRCGDRLATTAWREFNLKNKEDKAKSWGVEFENKACYDYSN